MKHLFILIAILFLYSCNSGKKNNQTSDNLQAKNDSIHIKEFFNSFSQADQTLKSKTIPGTIDFSDIEIQDNVCENNVYGIKITPHYTKQSKFDIYAFYIKIFNGTIPVKSNYSKGDDRHAGCKFANDKDEIEWHELISTSKKSVFIPYSILSLPEGTHTLTITSQISLNDSQNNEIFPTNTGKTIKSFEISQPKLHKLKIQISDLSVKRTKANGKKWDKLNLPDLRYKIYLSKDWRGETIYRSPVIKNKLSAHWASSNNGIIFLSPKDWFCIYIVDYDPAADDTIGEFAFTFNSFIDAVNSGFSFKKGQIKDIKLTHQILN